MGHVNPSLDQDSFRGRNDDGSESNATWKATVNTDWTQGVDENFRVRFLVQETAGGSENNTDLQLQRNLNGGGWVNVDGTSSVVRAVTSPNFNDDDSTTQQLGAGTFITPNAGMDEDNGLAGETNDIDFSGNDEVEVEYCLQVLSADVSDQDTIQLRVVRGDATVLESYTNTPTITVSAAAATARFETSWVEVEAPDVLARLETSWVEVETPDSPTRIETSWTEFEAPQASARIETSWVEFEAPDTPTRTEVSWAEFESPDSPTDFEVSWTEFEVPEVSTRFEVSWTELETPDSPTRFETSWAEFETPSQVDEARFEVSWSEFEVPDVLGRIEASWVEFETPDSPTRMDVSWAVIEAPVVGGGESNPGDLTLLYIG